MESGHMSNKRQIWWACEEAIEANRLVFGHSRGWWISLSCADVLAIPWVWLSNELVVVASSHKLSFTILCCFTELVKSHIVMKACENTKKNAEKCVGNQISLWWLNVGEFDSQIIWNLGGDSIKRKAFNLLVESLKQAVGYKNGNQDDGRSVTLTTFPMLLTLTLKKISSLSFTWELSISMSHAEKTLQKR